MKKLITIFCLISLVLFIANQATAAITTLTFEEFQDAQSIGTYYSGITFEAASSGKEWIAADATSNKYNFSSWPSGQEWNSGFYWIYDYVAASTCTDANYGNDGKISFNNQDATFVEIGYCAHDKVGQGIALYLKAYDSDDNLLDSVSGGSNLRHHMGDNNENGPGTLHVDWDGINPIAYVIINDTGNYWVVDNIKTDATPEPATIGLLGLGALSLLRRKR